MVLYRSGKPVAYGQDAVLELDEHPENVAYWFKVAAYPTIFIFYGSDYDYSYVCILRKSLEPAPQDSRSRLCLQALLLSEHMQI